LSNVGAKGAESGSKSRRLLLSPHISFSVLSAVANTGTN
jgi:hypothetical protein